MIYIVIIWSCWFMCFKRQHLYFKKVAIKGRHHIGISNGSGEDPNAAPRQSVMSFIYR